MPNDLNIALALRRRRAAAAELWPLPDGTRDPLDGLAGRQIGPPIDWSQSAIWIPTRFGRPRLVSLCQAEAA